MVPGGPGFADLADERDDAARQMQGMLALIAQLPKHEQDVFALCAWSELSYEDAALSLGVPIGAIRSRLSPARQHLRELDPALGHEQDTTANPQEALEP